MDVASLATFKIRRLPRFSRKLHRHHVLVGTLRREDQVNAGRACFHAEPLNRCAHRPLVAVVEHPVGELVVDEEDHGKSFSVAILAL